MARKQSNIYYRKDGRWEGRVHISGTKHYKSVYGKSYDEARKRLEKLRQEMMTPYSKCCKTFCDVFSIWLEEKKFTVKESSIAVYRLKFRKHIEPFFRQIKYENVTSATVNRFIYFNLEKGFSARYVSDMVTLLKSVVKWAQKIYGYVNKISCVEVPKSQKKECVLLNSSERVVLQNTLLKNIDNRMSLGIFLTMFTGIRIGELCGIKWNDIDIDKKLLHIRRTVQRINVSGEQSKTAVRISKPKTETSVRDIPLPQFLIEQLKKVKKPDENYLLSGNATPTEPRLVTYYFKNILKKAELPSIKFHSLRHSFASCCLQKEFDIKTLSEILGHSSADITMKVYVHSSLERKTECMNQICLL